MLTYQKIGEYVSAEPFRPFRIRMASGLFFEIRHPEMILVGRMTARVDTTSPSGNGAHWQDASLMLMEVIEPIDSSVVAPS